MKTVLCSAFLVFSTFCFSQKIDSTIVIGTWQSELDEDNTFGSFIFDKEGFVTIESQGVTMGGPNGMAKGKPIQMIYKLDVSKKPMQLDILVRKVETKAEMIAMRAIVQFSSDLKMKIAIDQEQRPTAFTTENSMSFSRIK
jgi:uncharacterized protein (TIGR03067 family)